MCITCDENGAIDEKMTIRGVLLARRDNSSWTREFYEKIVRLIMEEKKISCEEILNIINQDILQLLQWDQSTTDINQFVITKTLNDSYKVRPIDNDEKKAMKRLRDLEIEYPEKLDISLFNQHVGAGKSKVPFIQEYINRSKPAHVQLSQRMTERGLPISVGSRMEYIVIEHSQDPNTKMFEKLEDPTYFCDHCDVVRMDRLYYVKSIVIPVDQLLETVFKRKNMVKEIYDHHVKHLKLMKEWKSLNSKKLLYR
jgi:DNA polymerase elongation subunit (family B)